MLIIRSKLYYTASGVVTHCRWPSGTQSSLNLCTGRPPTQCDDTRCCITQDLLMMSTTVLDACRVLQLTYYRTRIRPSSCLITKIIMKCTVSKTSQNMCFIPFHCIRSVCCPRVNMYLHLSPVSNQFHLTGYINISILTLTRLFMTSHVHCRSCYLNIDRSQLDSGAMEPHMLY